jgi:hypothetical protein
MNSAMRIGKENFIYLPVFNLWLYQIIVFINIGKTEIYTTLWPYGS